jgi:hypothetical protein
MLAELEGPVLSQMTSIAMSALQNIVKKAASALWITNGGLLNGTTPELSLVFGFANVVMIEQPSFRLSTMDFDPDDTDYARSASLIIQQQIALQNDKDNQLDNHIIIDNGIPYISRYVLDDVENEGFSRQLQPVIEKGKFRPGLSLDFRQVGDIESLFFRPSPLGEVVLESTQILLEPQLYSLSRKVCFRSKVSYLVTDWGYRKH